MNWFLFKKNKTRKEFLASKYSIKISIRYPRILFTNAQQLLSIQYFLTGEEAQLWENQETQTLKNVWFAFKKTRNLEVETQKNIGLQIRSEISCFRSTDLRH